MASSTLTGWLLFALVIDVLGEPSGWPKAVLCTSLTAAIVLVNWGS